MAPRPLRPSSKAADQSLYGTTTMGGETGVDGETGVGTLFRLTLDGTFTQLHSFYYSQPGGVSPSGGLLETLPGTFYGTTPSGTATCRLSIA